MLNLLSVLTPCNNYNNFEILLTIFYTNQSLINVLATKLQQNIGPQYESYLTPTYFSQGTD